MGVWRWGGDKWRCGEGVGEVDVCTFLDLTGRFLYYASQCFLVVIQYHSLFVHSCDIHSV
jgi:hypothetical protein